MNTKSPEKQTLDLYFFMSGLPFSAVSSIGPFASHSQSAMVIGHTSAALHQDMSPKHPKPATFIGCSKAQNTTDHIFKDHHVLRVAIESSHVKAAKSADRFSALLSYKVISLKYNHSCKIHSTSQLANLP